MSKYLSEFKKIDGFSGIYSARFKNLRCVALRMKSGGLCLYSPAPGLGEEGRNSLKQWGDVLTLFAPNHYHNKGLTEYVQAFPTARLICSKAARPRLKKLSGLRFSGIDTLVADMPTNAELLEPEGLKTGEVWIVVRGQAGIAWIVTDALCGPDEAQISQAEKISILGTFPKYGIRDREIYRSWVREQIAKEPPTLVVPCHGGLVGNPTLASDIGTLIEKIL